MFVAGDAIATSIGLLNLGSPVAGIVVEELHLVAIDGVLHINKRALQHEEIVNLGQIVDAEGIDLFDELLLDG